MHKTITIHNGLAIYRLGAGAPLVFFPYPHASSLRPMAEDKLATFLGLLQYRRQLCCAWGAMTHRPRWLAPKNWRLE